MNKPSSIPRSPSALGSVQFASLLKQGLAACQRLGGELWTDYNEHDPGVTILEQLCYAITDAGARTELPVEELLARPAATRPTRDTLFNGGQILTSAPVTIIDYRKLLFGAVRNLKNVWLTGAEDACGSLLTLQVETFGVEERHRHSEAAGRQDVLDGVRQQMALHRNLCEDIASVTVLQPHYLTVRGVIEVGPGVNPTLALARVLFALQSEMIPFPATALPCEAVAAGQPYDAIFAGPLQRGGLIDSASLIALPASIAIEDLARLIARVPGIIRVEALELLADGAASPSSVVAIPPGHVPRLAPSIFLPLPPESHYPLVVQREGRPYPLEPARVFQELQRLLSELVEKQSFARAQMISDPYLAAPRSAVQAPERYYSIQHQFPHTYGMGANGLPAQGMDAAERATRLMQARQLKAYLTFFDQLLVDRFGQLSNLWQLFALDPALDASYFPGALLGAQPSDDAVPHLRDWNLLRQGSGQAKGQPAPLDYSVYLHASFDKPYILLRSAAQPSAALAGTLRESILQAGRHPQDFRAVRIAELHWRVVLDDGAGTALAFGTEPLLNEREANEAIVELAQRLDALAHDPQLCHQLLRIEQRGNAHIELRDAAGQVLLGARDLRPERQTRCVNVLIETGGAVDNYTIHKNARGKYRLYLFVHGQQIVQSELYGSFEAVLSARAAAAALVAALCCDPVARAAHLFLQPSGAGPVTDAGPDFYRDGVAQLARRFDDFPARRARFLDHLLSRFGEHFDDAALASFDPRLHGHLDGFYQDLLGWKLAMLRHCASLGSMRNNGYDYRIHGQPSLAGRSGLERRLFCLLGLLGTGGRAERPAAETPQPPPYRAWHEMVAPDVHDKAERARSWCIFASADPALFLALLKYGLVRANYRVKALPEQHGDSHHHDQPDRQERSEVWFTAEAAPQLIYVAESTAAAEQAITEMVTYFGRYFERYPDVYAGEELILVEHLLLRPALLPGLPPEAHHDDDSFIELDIIGWEWTAAHGWELVELHMLVQDSRCHRIGSAADGSHTALLCNRDGVPLARSGGHHSSEAAGAALRALGAHVARATAGPAPHDVDGFYPYRLSLFFPAWPLRFQNHGFRAFAERVVADNCPAHLGAECIWLDFQEMARFKQLHGHWMETKQRFEFDERRDPALGASVNHAAARLRRFMKLHVARVAA